MTERQLIPTILGKQKPPAGDRHLHLHGLSTADLAELARTGTIPDDKPTDSRHLIEGNSHPQ